MERVLAELTKVGVGIIHNAPLWAAIIGWATAQILKVIVTSIMEKKVNIGCLFASGGMPSSHSAFVTALCVVIGVTQGFDSQLFAIAAAFALVVMYDACGVRRAVGEQAKVLNEIIKAMNEDSETGGHKAIKEILGHSPFQVAMGWVVGLIIGIIFVSII